MSSSPPPKTPIRAITSTLITRASPSVPPASQLYEPQVRSVLAYRLRRVFLQSAGICWGVQVVWVVWQRGGVARLGVSGVVGVPFSVWTVLGALLFWVAAALPIVVLRKTFLTAQRTTATSPQASLAAALAKPSTKPAFATYVVSAVVIAVVHVAMGYTLESYSRGDPGLSTFVKSKKHPHFLNGRFLFLLLSQIAAAATFSLRNMLRDRFAFKWVSMASAPPSPIFQTLIAFIASAVSTTSSLPLACAAFGLLRTLVLPVLFKLPLVYSLLRPFMAHFTKGPYTLSLLFTHLPLLTRSWFVAFTTSFLWEATDSFFSTLISEPVSLTSATAHPTTNQTLIVSGITSCDMIMKYFAFCEMRGVVDGRGQRALAERQALFGGGGGGGGGSSSAAAAREGGANLWSTFVRESLLLLGEDYQRLLRRGGPAPPPAVASAPASTVPTPGSTKKWVEGLEDRVHATPTPLLRRSVFKSTAQGAAGGHGEAALDTLASDGVVATVVEKTSEAVHLPDLFKSVSAGVLKASQVGVESAGGGGGGGGGALASHPEEARPALGAALWGKVADSLRDMIATSYREQAPVQLKENVEAFWAWWSGERVSRAVDASLSMRELDVIVIDVLTKLVCLSLEEDRYGVVQRDIPKILEALLSYLSAVEDYRAEIVEKYSPALILIPESLDEGDAGEEGEGKAPPRRLTKGEIEARRVVLFELDKGTDLLGSLEDGLKDGIVRVVRTFGDKLTAFRFPPRIAAKLQGFVDFC